MKYFVHVCISQNRNAHDKEYMVSIDSQSALAAEHYFLDRSFIGKHCYSVNASQAFSMDELGETFLGCMRSSATVSEDEMIRIIEERNDNIRMIDHCEEKIEKAKKALEEAKAQANSAKILLDSAEAAFRMHSMK